MRLFLSMPILVSLATALTSCGTSTPDATTPKTLRQAQTSMTDTAPLSAFIASAKSILANETRTGTIPARQFVNLMPLNASDRQRLTQAFPGVFAVTCHGAVCSAQTSGSKTVVTLQAAVRIIFLITNPQMTVANQIKTDFILRGDQSVEFCRTSGLTVAASGLTRTIYGLTDQVQGGVPQLTVSDAAGDLACR